MRHSNQTVHIATKQSPEMVQKCHFPLSFGVFSSVTVFCVLSVMRCSRGALCDVYCVDVLQEKMPAMTAMDAQAIVAAGAAPSNTISLSTLIDYIIQRTYHELSILSEL